MADGLLQTRVLKDTTTMVAIDLNETTAFCTDRGYGNIQLKVSVPDLDILAHFDHRVVGEGQPCITAGRCSPSNGPGAIIDPKEPMAVVPMRVVLEDLVTIDEATATCSHQLRETVTSLIRGKKFSHLRSGLLEPMSYEKCLKLAGL